MIRRIFFPLSPMTSWANDSFPTFTAIKSSSVICFSLNLQSPIPFRAPVLPSPCQAAYCLKHSQWGAVVVCPQGTFFSSVFWDLLGWDKSEDKEKDKYFLPGTINALLIHSGEPPRSTDRHPNRNLGCDFSGRVPPARSPECEICCRRTFASRHSRLLVPALSVPPWLRGVCEREIGRGSSLSAARFFDTSNIAQAQLPSAVST